MDETKVDKKKRTAVLVFLFIFITGAAALFFYIRYKAVHITTDDAYVDGRIHTVASKARGTVKAVYVEDNQIVKKGDLLIEIDPEDYDAKVSEASSGLEAQKAKIGQAEAALETAQRQLAQSQASLESARATLHLQRSYHNQALRDLKRAGELFKEEILSKERYERAETEADVAASKVQAALEQVRQAEAAQAAQVAIVRQAEAVKKAVASEAKKDAAILTTALLNQGYTKVYASQEGFITKKAVQRGNFVQIGQPLMAIVALDDIWITANYKETQVSKIKPGQKVDITVDTYSGKSFTGRVDSIMSGTGAVFSLFPPENATGQFVKVVQRIPVKIRIEKDSDKDHVLRIGMSVVPTVVVEQ